MNGTRIIDTGLTGQTNLVILNSVMGQLSDGMWENTPMMAKFWRNADISEQNGRIVIAVKDGWDSGFNRKDETWIKSWFAGKIKQIVYEETGGQQWDRKDATPLDFLGGSGRGDQVTVSNAYQAYEILKGRNIKNKYGVPESMNSADKRIAREVNWRKKAGISDSMKHPKTDQLVQTLLADSLEASYVEPSKIEPSSGKTKGSFKFPTNYKVGHAIKGEKGLGHKGKGLTDHELWSYCKQQAKCGNQDSLAHHVTDSMDWKTKGKLAKDPKIAKAKRDHMFEPGLKANGKMRTPERFGKSGTAPKRKGNPWGHTGAESL